MPLHNHKNIKVAWGRGGGCSQTNCQIRGLYIPQRPKQVNLSTEVVKGVVPKLVSKWYMVRVVPKVVPKCCIEGGIEIRIPIIIIIILYIYIYFFFTELMCIG